MTINWATLKTAEEKESKRLESLALQVRSDRDVRLAKTDFYLLPDSPQQPEGLLAYRQALRDISDQEGFPENVLWPELPTG